MVEQPVEAFPLCWPRHRQRAKYREHSRFKTSFAKARDNIIAEISRLGGKQAIISSNIELRRDGLPYANFAQPDDTGVAVYFTYKGKQMCFACDRYRHAECNMHAISLTISALRGIARWGTGDMMESAFTGFTALPSPEAMNKRDWRDVLELGANTSLERAQENYRRLRSIRHPDKGGSHDAMTELNLAWDRAQTELRAS